MEHPRLLGLSHLIFAHWPDDAAQALPALGYRLATRARLDNPEARRPFLNGPMSPHCRMDLYAGAKGMPTVELIAEDPATAPSGEAEIFSVRHPGDGPPAPGWSGGGEGLAVTVAVPDPGLSAAFWDAFGLRPQDGGDDVRIRVPGSLLGRAADLRMVAGPGGCGGLDQRGLVCVSLLCADAAATARHLAVRGHAPGDCFRLSPMGRSITIFFVRGPGGELYEFMSYDRAA